MDSDVLEELLPQLKGIPRVCLDHFGLSKGGFDTVVKLAEGDAYVKASGSSGVDFSISSALKTLYDANPNGLIFGTDLPGTRAPRPFCIKDDEVIRESFSQLDGKDFI